MSDNPTQTIVVKSEKNLVLALLLTFFFGPLGLLYATILGGIVMLVVNLVVGILTFGIGLAVTWPITMLWALLATLSYNKNLRS